MFLSGSKLGKFQFHAVNHNIKFRYLREFSAMKMAIFLLFSQVSCCKSVRFHSKY